jgi:O-antigen/teichoic acid export membrane protein
MWFVPAATLLLCIQNAASSIASRNARFAVIVRSRIALAAAGVTTSLLGGWLHIGEAGLMLGNLAGMLAACLVFLAGRQPACSSAVRRPSFKELQTTVRRFSEFPRWQLPAAFIDVVATQSPVWFISSYFGIDVLGQYSFAGRVLGTPLQLLGASFGEVFRQQASAEWRRLGRCRETVGHYGFVLGSIFLPIVVLLAILGPRLVVAVFGARWLLAGEFVRYLALLYALRGSVGTLSYVLILGGRQRSVFVVHLLFLTCSGCALAAAAAGFGPVATIAVLIGSNAWVYLAYARIIAQTSSGGGATTITPGTDANSR